ncbi:uncharacterized protein LOC134829616 [Culicoides brevitarsis]|uniref:uncharacterized protein LOC134829616 n=1 Tax=Culicoides brevitarsis TaxID=469753 RepID=UPI00307C7017
MSKNKIFLLIFTSFVLKVSSECNICGSISQAACISEDQYFPCINNIPNFSQILRCPAGSVCSNVAGVCDSNLLTPACPLCGVCNAPGGYACLSQTTYSPCSAGTSINWPISCPEGTICYPTGSNTSPCTTMTWQQTQRCPTGSPPVITTSTTATTSMTTQAPIQSPHWFCRYNNPGYYANKNDVSCRTYIYCFWYFGMTGQLMGCGGNRIFNPSTRTCVMPGTNGFVCPVI